MLGCLASLAAIVVAALAGLGKFSFWWVVIPSFIGGAFALTDEPHHSRIIAANASGNLWYFPFCLAVMTISHLLVAGAVYGVTAVVF